MNLDPKPQILLSFWSKQEVKCILFQFLLKIDCLFVCFLAMLQQQDEKLANDSIEQSHGRGERLYCIRTQIRQAGSGHTTKTRAATRNVTAY